MRLLRYARNDSKKGIPNTLFCLKIFNLCRKVKQVEKNYPDFPQGLEENPDEMAETKVRGHNGKCHVFIFIAASCIIVLKPYLYNWLFLLDQYNYNIII
jgi:hypothetical protein